MFKIFKTAFLCIVLSSPLVRAEPGIEIAINQTSLSNQTDQQSTQKLVSPQFKELVKNYGFSVISGILTGALTGTGCAYFEYAFKVSNDLKFTFKCLEEHFYSWVIFRCSRLGILGGIKKCSEKYAIPIENSILENTAWVSDWIAYLLLNGILYSEKITS